MQPTLPFDSFYVGLALWTMPPYVSPCPSASRILTVGGLSQLNARGRTTGIGYRAGIRTLGLRRGRKHCWRRRDSGFARSRPCPMLQRYLSGSSTCHAICVAIVARCLQGPSSHSPSPVVCATVPSRTSPCCGKNRSRIQKVQSAFEASFRARIGHDSLLSSCPPVNRPHPRHKLPLPL
ncbi:hypothetical protein EXIGLDRAFT_329892 [Exidia glandulosa HHB12029]|uniref:Uncharacterized protein n=1 Tax=Exidia glandulosa HHB12029 TaxID=1314781 RepID=A0A165CSS9_EXIGL|nr:hypothetical protein EXIGLDRAFT_329892 [Exidia glandulosa HHB12029]